MLWKVFKITVEIKTIIEAQIEKMKQLLNNYTASLSHIDFREPYLVLIVIRLDILGQCLLPN